MKRVNGQFVKEAPADRFWAKVEKHSSSAPVCNGTKCWLWTAALFNGRYGQFWNGTNLGQAHRYSWQLHYGAIPASLMVLHRCDNPACVNPKHLFLGTHQDNMDDRNTKGRTAAGSKCYFYHHKFRGSVQTNAKLYEFEVREIRAFYATGKFSQQDLAAIYGVIQNLISKIVLRKSWKHVK